MVTLTGSFSSSGVGCAWPPVLVALWGEMVRGEDALGMAMAGPAVRPAVLFSTTDKQRRMLMMTGDSCLDWLIQQGPRLLPLTRPPLHPLESWCFPVTGCVVCPKQNDTKQTLDATRLWRKRHTFSDSHKRSTHKPNSMSCSPGEEEQSTFRRRSCSKMTVCWMGLVCVCATHGD